MAMATQYRAAAKEEDKPKPAAGVTKDPEEKDKNESAAAAEGSRVIRLPDWYIKRIQERGLRRPSPLPEGFLDDDPKFREMVLDAKEAANAAVDVEEDVLKQVRDKGYAEVLLEFVDGVAKHSIIPKPNSEEACTT